MTKLPSVGFDRFVELSWLDFALDLAVMSSEPEQLKNWLGTQIEGKVSTRKTYNLLSNLWLKSFPETEQIRAKALELAPEVLPQDRIILHWGMAIANFELFQRTTFSMGNLLRLQGEFKKKDIQQRIAEMYSNQGTIPRAVSRIIQSLCCWNVIQETDTNTYISVMNKSMQDEAFISWLLQASLNRQRNRNVSIMEIFRLPELFPFDVPDNAAHIIRNSADFTVIREGLDQEYVMVNSGVK